MKHWFAVIAVAILCGMFMGFTPLHAQVSDFMPLSPLQMADKEYQTALTNWGDGKSADNEALLKSALTIRTQVLGPDHPSVADVLERLGAIDYNRKHYQLAETKFRQALAIYTQSYGEQNILTLHTMGDLGAALREETHYAEAQKIVERSVILRRQTLPPDSPLIAGGLNNLGRIYLAQAQYAKARATLEESLRIFKSAGAGYEPNVRDDEALLNRTAEEETSAGLLVHWFTLRALASGLGMMVFGGIMIGCVLVAERSYANKPPSAPPAYIVPIVTIARMGAMLAAIFCGVGVAQAVLHYVGVNPREFSYAPIIGGVAAVGLFPFLVQITINIARPWAGLEPLPFTIFGRPERESLWLGHAPGRGSATPWFPATDVTWARARTLFKVFVTPHALCGARIDPLWGVFMGLPGQSLDAVVWTQSAQARAYDLISPESEDFRRLDKANFQLLWKDISSLAYSPGRQWLTSARSDGGMLTVELRSGELRALFLIGKQNGEALKAELERYRNAAVAEDTVFSESSDLSSKT